MDVSSKPLVVEGLAAHRAKTARRRAIAFCDAPEYIFGIRVKPLTPATWTMLVATGSRFVHGETALEADVRNYLWFHSPEYSLTASRATKERALRRFTMMASQPWRRWLAKVRWLGVKPDMARYCSVLFTVANEIEALISDAFADAPVQTGVPGKPLATIEAQLIVEFARELHWAPDQTRHTPLRQLFQHLRCIRASKGDEPADASEDALVYEHLKKRNDALAAEREKAAHGG